MSLSALSGRAHEVRGRRHESASKTGRLRSGVLAMMLVAATLFAGVNSTIAGAAPSRADLRREGAESLRNLYRISPVALDLSSRAKAVLVFPSIVKAGVVFGGSYGEGVMTKGVGVVGYYDTVSLSWGLQTGAQSYGYALFLMSDKALRHLDKADRWEIGVGPTVILVDEALAKTLSGTIPKGDAYAFIFDQESLMARLSMDGTKVSKIAQ